MHFSYLKKTSHLIFILLIISSIYFSFLSVLSAVSAIYLLFLIIYRHRKISIKNSREFHGEDITSPVNGKVSTIRQIVLLNGVNQYEILINITFGSEMGIYSPLTSELIHLNRFHGKSLWRETISEFSDISLFQRDDLKFKNSVGSFIGLVFVKSKFGGVPLIRLLQGDRVKARVNIGHLPFGGSLLLYLPADYKIVVEEGASLNAANTLIAQLKDTL